MYEGAYNLGVEFHNFLMKKKKTRTYCDRVACIPES